MNHPIVVKISENRDLKDYGLKTTRHVLETQFKDFADPIIDRLEYLVDLIEENEPLAAGMIIRKSDNDASKMGITLFVIDDSITVLGESALFFKCILLNGMRDEEHYYSTIPDITIQGMIYGIENFIVETTNINLLSESGFRSPSPGEVHLSRYYSPGSNYLTMNI